MCAALTRYQDRESVLRLTQDVILPAATETIVKLFYQIMQDEKPV
jgi:hypothetical protein